MTDSRAAFGELIYLNQVQSSVIQIRFRDTNNIEPVFKSTYDIGKLLHKYLNIT